jgi:hypothetical protein
VPDPGLRRLKRSLLICARSICAGSSHVCPRLGLLGGVVDDAVLRRCNPVSRAPQVGNEIFGSILRFQAAFLRFR